MVLLINDIDNSAWPFEIDQPRSRDNIEKCVEDSVINDANDQTIWLDLIHSMIIHRDHARPTDY